MITYTIDGCNENVARSKETYMVGLYAKGMY